MDIKKIIEEMSIEEKLSLCIGQDMWHTKSMPKYGIDSIIMSDGPCGLRYQSNAQDNLGINNSNKATCFPTPVTVCNSWNKELYEKEADAIAKEALYYGVSMVLGPGCNIKRNPLCGRNFEYLSEDPLLAGKMAAGFIKGIEKNGVSSSIKHFACNNQEYKRQNSDSQIDDRTLNEIYLKPFEIATKEGKPATVMCSYNRINGTYASDNKLLLNDILREKWGFDGMVVTDWGAMNNAIEAFKAGCDLNMPGGSNYMRKELLEAIKSGSLAIEDVDKSVERILKIIEKGLNKPKVDKLEVDKHHAIAKEMAIEGAVLLKNENILPLKMDECCLIGDMGENIRYQGSGSSHINPTRLIQPKDLFNISYCKATNSNGELVDLNGAISLAQKHKKVIVFVGLPESYESEAFDRESIDIPQGYTQLINELAKVNKNIVVVLFGGSVMKLDFEENAKAILYMGLAGQGSSEAIYDLLTGKGNPSGKLSESWPYKYEDVVSKDCFGLRTVEYREGIYVGYRYYDKASVSVRYPFGYGLSYSKFEYSNLEINNNMISCQIKNTSQLKGKEIVQLYVASKDNAFRPIKELKDFAKIELEANETKTVLFEINDRYFEVYKDGFKKVSGEYEIIIAASSKDIKLSKIINVSGDEISFAELKNTWYENLSNLPSRDDWLKLMGREVKPLKVNTKGDFDKNNSALEMKDYSFIMKIQYLVTKMIINKQFKKEERNCANPAYKMMITCATDCPVRCAEISSNGAIKDGITDGLICLANGHFFKGLSKIIKSMF